ncbi:glycoside hydrolase family 15 protein [Sinosporangium siamense]|uniref:Glucoamylase n=1 Tax=Sinosporangium siamense TaxID=1367973 RepID=A0A919RMY6_9ACTN|nr:glycoside hydrolase family 15 protein [Sinosporangium siamense]GII96518.1 glucoamylase [Sinosporangium siamense]
MPRSIESHALIGDTHTAALVDDEGRIDWLCLPRFDSGACFAALLGAPENGYWQIAPAGGGSAVRRGYRDDTLVLETEFAADGGRVRVIDCMPVRDGQADLVRRVEGLSGNVRMRCTFVPRFDYGRIPPWFNGDGRRVHAFAGPDSLTLSSGADLGVADGAVKGDFTVGAGEVVAFHLAWTPTDRKAVPIDDIGDAVETTTRWWRRWIGEHDREGPYRKAVTRSLITLKALTYAPGGGVVAAPTTSLPEVIGGSRNWDYRYCWVRDAAFALLAFLDAGYAEEAFAWREWLLRAVAGRPEQMQIMYGVAGERRVPEMELPWLAGYARSSPVRLGNAAAEQLQLDVYGELMNAFHHIRINGIGPQAHAWEVQRALLDFLESNWREPDQGIWEMRGHPRQFTFSKVMAWVAADRTVKDAERFGLAGPVDRWRRLRQEIFDDVCRLGYDDRRATFTQSYGRPALDAALLRMPLVGFLPARDERIAGTVAAIESELRQKGLVRRYKPRDEADGLPGEEAAFLPCTFWLADVRLLQGRTGEAVKIFEHLLGLRNDVGLLAEEYDPGNRRFTGNFPQALSHIALIHTALQLTSALGARRAA